MALALRVGGVAFRRRRPDANGILRPAAFAGRHTVVASVTEARAEIDSHGPSAQPPAAHAEQAWVARHCGGEGRYELSPGAARRLDRYVTRILAPNPGVMTGPGTNTYLVGEEELAVIDPGPEDPSHLQAILQAGAGRIRWILCSHTHVDHAAGAASISKATGAPIAAMPAPRTEHDVDLALDRPLHDGEVIHIGGVSIRALATPGHASNQICFLLEDTRMLFTGDHIMQGSTVVIWPPDGNMAAYLRSLRQLATLELAILAPGHGYLIGDPRLAIDRLIQHRLARENKVRRALRNAGGTTTLNALLPPVYDDVAPALYPFAVRSLEAHLEKLVEDGDVAVEPGSGAYVLVSSQA